MKTLWLAAVLAATGAAPAAAADLSARIVTKAPAADAAGYNWGGWYAGGNLGGSWGTGNVSDVFVSGATPFANAQAAAAATPRLSPEGFTGGGQIGYNYQVDRWLFGVEADAGYLGLKQSRSVTAPFPVGLGAFTTSNAVTADWLVSLRPRVGYAVDRTLLYATGGLALTELNFGTGYSDSTGQNEAASSSKVVAGWTAGAGIEHAFASNWSAKVEYLYSDFGKQSVTGPVLSGPTTTTGIISRDIDLKTNTVRGGLNYHFGGPSVARY
ncbi:MAG: outer membrane beta-barrel protein [Tardiphaga sp.]